MDASRRATRLAKAGVEASDGKNAEVLDTYARALFETGKTAEAIEYQKQAVARCEEEAEQADMQNNLKKYQAAADKAEQAKR